MSLRASALEGHEGRHEEGVELLRNALVAARLSETECSTQELGALPLLIRALFVTDPPWDHPRGP